MQHFDKVLIRFFGKSVMEGWIFYFHHDIFFLKILFFFFVSWMLVCALRHPSQGRIARGTYLLGLITYISAVCAIVFRLTTAECATGNEPDRNDGASGSGTEAPPSSAVEDKLIEFLAKNGKRAPQQKVFDTTVEELKLQTADTSDLSKMLLLMADLEKKKFSSPSEAAAQLVLDYSVY